jgi:hypothetical protein
VDNAFATRSESLQTDVTDQGQVARLDKVMKMLFRWIVLSVANSAAHSFTENSARANPT